VSAITKQPEPTPKFTFCEEKHLLSQEFVNAIKELLSLQNQQTLAVIAGDPDFSRLEAGIPAAGERKDQAKYALLAHIEAHGCQAR